MIFQLSDWIPLLLETVNSSVQNSLINSFAIPFQEDVKTAFVLKKKSYKSKMYFVGVLPSLSTTGTCATVMCAFSFVVRQ